MVHIIYEHSRGGLGEKEWSTVALQNIQATVLNHSRFHTSPCIWLCLLQEKRSALTRRPTRLSERESEGGWEGGRTGEGMMMAGFSGRGKENQVMFRG